KEWQVGQLVDLFAGSTVVNADPEKPEEQLPTGQEIAKAQEEQRAMENEKFAALAERLIEELKKFFRPEVLNRFDEVIVFRPLSATDVLAIVDLQFKQLAKLLEEQNIGLEVTPLAKQQVAILGYDPIYGARPLRRAIQRHVENPISSMIIKEEVKAGEMILVDFDGNDFVFTVQKPIEAAQAVATQKYLCLDCGKEFEVPIGEEKEPEVSGPEAPAEKEPVFPYGLSVAQAPDEPTGEGKDTMSPPTANFTDDQAQLGNNQAQLDDQAQLGNNQAQLDPDDPLPDPAVQNESAGQPDSLAPVQDDSAPDDAGEDTGAGNQPADSQPPENQAIDQSASERGEGLAGLSSVVCPYCGSKNVKLIEEESASAPPNQRATADKEEEKEERPAETPPETATGAPALSLEDLYGMADKGQPGSEPQATEEPTAEEPAAEMPAPVTSPKPAAPADEEADNQASANS
ncbi:hypothetical protein FJZ40_05155, partial [Candidatus Shapirobacteria bacterium]|nr:hypothetical protein [Candidatus Shapirobacteria bacterium]